MTNNEFEIAVANWEARMEDLVMEMCRITTFDGLPCVFNYKPLVEQFTKSVDELRASHHSGACRGLQGRTG